MKLLGADRKVVDLRANSASFTDRTLFRLRNEESAEVIVKFGPYSWDMEPTGPTFNVPQSSLMLAKPAPGEVVAAGIRLVYVPLEPGSRALSVNFPPSGIINVQFRMMVFDPSDAHALSSPREVFDLHVVLYAPNDGRKYSPMLRLHTSLDVEGRLW